MGLNVEFRNYVEFMCLGSSVTLLSKSQHEV